jgi:hypothetical protein
MSLFQPLHLIPYKNTQKLTLWPIVDFGQQLTFWSTLTKVNPNPLNPKFTHNFPLNIHLQEKIQKKIELWPVVEFGQQLTFLVDFDQSQFTGLLTIQNLI